MVRLIEVLVNFAGIEGLVRPCIFLELRGQWGLEKLELVERERPDFAKNGPSHILFARWGRK